LAEQRLAWLAGSLPGVLQFFACLCRHATRTREPKVEPCPMSSASLHEFSRLGSGGGERRAAPASARVRGLHPPASLSMLYSGPLGTAEPALQFQSFDAAYVDNLREGEPRTQQHFVGYFSELLRFKLRSRLKSSHAIEDVSQETFARVFAVLRKDGGLRQPERLGSFVNTVCNHVLFEQYRLSSRSESLDVEGRPELPAVGASALDVVAEKQIKSKVREILLDLPLRDRSLLKAVFLDERDRNEVCREFGVDREYLRVLLHRAKQEFKSEYLKRIGKETQIGASR
jgi:RNA polymerase sigma-70 factor (ECF subfamily)